MRTQRHTELELDIVDLSHEGRGVARVNGKACFVAGALPGERVRAKITRGHRQFDEAETVEVLTAAPDRVAPRCPHFGVCGGCALQHMAPTAQIAAKEHNLLENLERIGKVTPERMLPALSGSPWGYRRRGRLSAKWVAKKDKLLIGFRELDGRFVADLSRCPVLDPKVGADFAPLAALIAGMDAKLTIPQIEIAVGDDVAALVFRHLQPLSDADRGRLIDYATAHGVAIYLQPGGNDSVHALWPTDARLEFRLPQYQLAIEFQPLDFIQVNGAMNERMIEHALALLDPDPSDDLLDLFCGLGNFTLPLARRARSVVGVEGESGLVARARANAARNGLDNAEFFAADLSQDQRDAPWAKRDYPRILLDPARAGASAVFDYLPRKSTHRIVYVSCHPGSLARDAGILCERHGFRLAAAGVMDMFPHTAHVESIALFER
jgi:23S rRNA (uracil1939-C5)-methyltransferase